MAQRERYQVLEQERKLEKWPEKLCDQQTA
jgi:hypothetical protein